MRNTSKLKSKKQLKSGGSLGGGGQLVPLKSLSARKRLRARSEKMQKKYQEDQERFWSKVDKTETCWLWTAGKTHKGYGQFTTTVNQEETKWGSHRYSYELLVGPIPDDLVLDHLCKIRHCVNPSHLEPVTLSENTRRGNAGKFNARKTHCPQGHPYSGDNLRMHNGRRHCITCTKANSARSYRDGPQGARETNLIKEKRTLREVCSIKNCDRRHQARGWCKFHYTTWRNHGDPLWRPPTPEQRFWPKVDKNGPVPEWDPDLGPCWLWTASTNVGGYGQFSLDNRPMTSHRFSYSSIVGEIPEGYFLDHLCRVRLCCNPTHLEPVTPQENTLRGAICFETIH
jgi:hypothetical protein